MDKSWIQEGLRTSELYCEVRQDEQFPKAAKFPKGSFVRYTGNNKYISHHVKDNAYEVLACKDQGEDWLEYGLKDFPYLVYEDEIQLVENQYAHSN